MWGGRAAFLLVVMERDNEGDIFFFFSSLLLCRSRYAFRHIGNNEYGIFVHLHYLPIVMVFTLL